MLKTNNIIIQSLHNLKIEKLTLMQENVLKIFSAKKDIILLSPTGSGKTLAYLLPLLNSLHSEKHKVQAMILVPSRELALQIDTVFRMMKTAWTSACCYGGHSISEEKRILAQNCPTIIIGTPGRITDHLKRKNINSTNIHTLIIDEFDKSLELGFQNEMSEIVNNLPRIKKKVLSSATEIENIPDFLKLEQTIKLDYLPKIQNNVDSRLTIMKVHANSKDKIEVLYQLLCASGHGSYIVFCNHRDAVDRIYKLLVEKKISVERFHGGMEQIARERSLYKFRNGSSYVLIATDLAARGLDIAEIKHVIHYHLPINEETFIHRNGRAARWNTTGTSYLILNESENVPTYIQGDIETFKLPIRFSRFPQPLWDTLYIGKGKKEKISRIDIVGFLYKKGNLNKDDIGMINIKEHYSFVAVSRSKVNILLKLVQGEKIKGMKTIIEKAK